ncbi:hypothetical protein [Pararhodobacter oceanensis]|uniref:hypothetical protein n=1 Tax=Pararhodobacter oceanensis TaxID=2172121 RepID=UPI001057BA9E|nr:hypothetical protein [Pararhodobacter oceanensis]
MSQQQRPFAAAVQKNEYLWQDEAGRSAPAGSPVVTGSSLTGGFTLHGHRLSSLYRTPDSRGAWLTNIHHAASSCQKYSKSHISTGNTAERTGA